MAARASVAHRLSEERRTREELRRQEAPLQAPAEVRLQVGLSSEARLQWPVVRLPRVETH